MLYMENGGLPEKYPLFRLILKLISSMGGILSIIFCKIYIPKYLHVGKNVKLSPKGNILLGARQIGDNCRIYNNVTFGRAMIDDEDTLRNKNNPIIGNNVVIGPDTLVFGDIHIGDGVTILNNSIVSKNIPGQSVVSGNPARIIRRNFDNTHFLSLPFDSWEININNLDN